MRLPTLKGGSLLGLDSVEKSSTADYVRHLYCISVFGNMCVCVCRGMHVLMQGCACTDDGVCM